MHYWLTWLLEKVSRRRRIIFILRFTYEYNLIYMSPLFLLLIQKELKLQQLAKTKSRIHIQHPPMIWTHIWKIKWYLIKMFNCFLFRKLYIRCKTTKTSLNSKDFIENGYIPICIVRKHIFMALNLLREIIFT